MLKQAGMGGGGGGAAPPPFANTTLALERIPMIIAACIALGFKTSGGLGGGRRPPPPPIANATDSYAL